MIETYGDGDTVNVQEVHPEATTNPTQRGMSRSKSPSTRRAVSVSPLQLVDHFSASSSDSTSPAPSGGVRVWAAETADSNDSLQDFTHDGPDTIYMTSDDREGRGLETETAMLTKVKEARTATQPIEILPITKMTYSKDGTVRKELNTERTIPELHGLENSSTKKTNWRDKDPNDHGKEIAELSQPKRDLNETQGSEEGQTEEIASVQIIPQLQARASNIQEESSVGQGKLNPTGNRPEVSPDKPATIRTGGEIEATKTLLELSGGSELSLKTEKQEQQRTTVPTKKVTVSSGVGLLPSSNTQTSNMQTPRQQSVAVTALAAGTTATMPIMVDAQSRLVVDTQGRLVAIRHIQDTQAPHVGNTKFVSLNQLQIGSAAARPAQVAGQIPASVTAINRLQTPIGGAPRPIGSPQTGLPGTVPRAPPMVNPVVSVRPGTSMQSLATTRHVTLPAEAIKLFLKQVQHPGNAPALRMKGWFSCSLLYKLSIVFKTTRNQLSNIST